LRWHIVTGEYPPQPGGVSDYTRLVARGLAEAGDEVHVWAPQALGPSPADAGVRLHRLPGHFGPVALVGLHRALAHDRRPFRLLVQYVPHMYGWKAMNVLFCGWLRWVCPVRPWVMFHEVAFPVTRDQPLRHNLLGLVNRGMARAVARSAERVFVSVPRWMELLERIAGRRYRGLWLPVPSNVATQADPQAAAAVRARYAPGAGSRLIGHFGTFGGAIAGPLVRVLAGLLGRDRERRALLVGRGGEVVVKQLAAWAPNLGGRVFATGGLPADDVAAHLAACNLLVQPYPDGASTRRGSLMAGIALGLPVVTTHGPATESIWAEQGLAALVPAGDEAAMQEAAEDMLTKDAVRAELGRRGRAGYDAHFSLRHTIAGLRVW
jgi:glycosyltransferase involved in cell wall biosynthesis